MEKRKKDKELKKMKDYCEDMEKAINIVRS